MNLPRGASGQGRDSLPTGRAGKDREGESPRGGHRQSQRSESPQQVKPPVLRPLSDATTTPSQHSAVTPSQQRAGFAPADSPGNGAGFVPPAPLIKQGKIPSLQPSPASQTARRLGCARASRPANRARNRPATFLGGAARRGRGCPCQRADSAALAFSDCCARAGRGNRRLSGAWWRLEGRF